MSKSLLCAFAAFGSFAAFGLSTFLALDGRDGIGRRSLFLFRLHRRRSDNGGDGEVLVLVRRLNPLGKLNLADVDRIADLEPVERDVYLVRDVRRVADDLQLVADDVEDAAALE